MREAYSLEMKSKERFVLSRTLKYNALHHILVITHWYI